MAVLAGLGMVEGCGSSRTDREQVPSHEPACIGSDCTSSGATADGGEGGAENGGEGGTLWCSATNPFPRYPADSIVDCNSGAMNEGAFCSGGPVTCPPLSLRPCARWRSLL